MSSSSSRSDSQPSTPKKLFGRQKPLHAVLGGGKGADIVLWRNKRLSAGILGGSTVIWLLFEVVGYHFLALLCHIAIVAMLVVFIWSNGAALLELPPPQIPGVNLLSEADFKELVPTFQPTLRRSLSFLRDVAYGQDLKLFLSTVASFWIVSVIGSYYSFLGLLYFVFLCILTLPVLYENFEPQVDHLADKASHDLQELLGKFGEQLRSKIASGPAREMKVQ